MNKSKKDDNSFLLQAGILAAASIITRVIGLLYRSPLNSIIGKLGMGYYQTAYAYYTIILLISSYSIPSAISKVIAQRLALKEYKNAHRIFKVSLYYVIAVGGAASLLLFFGAGLFCSGEDIKVLRVLAPTVFVYGLLGVLRGYFQAHKTMVPTGASQIIEQIVNAAVSIGAACIFINITCHTLAKPDDIATNVDRAVAGAMGSALGTGAGVVSALIFMFFIYLLNRGVILTRVYKDRHANVLDYGAIVKEITMIVMPFILSTAIYNFTNFLNTKIYTDIYPAIRGLDKVTIKANWGIFSGQAQTISNIPIAFANAMASAMIPSVAQLMAAGHRDSAKDKVSLATKTTMLIAIPSCIGLGILAKPIVYMLFPQGEEDLNMAALALVSLAVSVVLFSLSTLNSSILQGIGKVYTPMINSAIALVVQTVVMVVLLVFTNVDFYGVAIANTVYSGLMCILNQVAVRKSLGYKQEITKTFIMPLAAGLFMGLGAWIVYQVMFILTGSLRISLIPAVIVAVTLYFVMVIALRALDEDEILALPKGAGILKLAKKMRLIK
ncbi:MAG: polysaccharide biosynthesis protein [Lachnospiraceae bacterium]|nr:polysaccharide biosynthesis protein [Lachnospiraceae bacterium]